MGLNLQKKPKKIYSYYRQCKKNADDPYDKEVIDTDDCLWAKQIEETLEHIKNIVSNDFDFHINDISLFDKYQGPYASVRIFGKTYQVWTINEHGFDELYIRDFKVNNMDDHEHPGYRGTSNDIIDMIKEFGLMGFPNDDTEEDIQEGLNLSKKSKELPPFEEYPKLVEYIQDRFLNFTVDYYDSNILKYGIETVSINLNYKYDYDYRSYIFYLDTERARVLVTYTDEEGDIIDIGEEVFPYTSQGIYDIIEWVTNIILEHKEKMNELNEGLNLSKKERCPVCGSNNTKLDSDFPETMKNCDTCGTEWNKDGDITFDPRETSQCCRAPIRCLDCDDCKEKGIPCDEYICTECGATIWSGDENNDLNEGLNLRKKTKDEIRNERLKGDRTQIKMSDGSIWFISEVIDILHEYSILSKDELMNMSPNELSELWDEFNMSDVMADQMEKTCEDCGSADLDSDYNYDTGRTEYICRDCGRVQLDENKKIMKKQILETGKLKLVEVLTPTDIAQITSIAKDEAKKQTNTVKTDLEKNISDVKKQQQTTDKSLEKHTQNKSEHLGEKDIIKLNKKEIDIVKSDIEKNVDDKITKAMSSKDLEKKVRDMFVDAMTDYHKTLWVKRGFWSGSVKK
jgi:transposase-like protein